MPKKPHHPPARPQNITEYPKWVNGVLCDNAEQEEAAKAKGEVPASPDAAQPTQSSVAAPELTDAEKLKLGTVALAKRLNVELIDDATAEDDLEMIALSLEERAKEAFAPSEEPETVDEDERIDREGGQQAPYVEIPENWRDEHHLKLTGLAKRLTGAESMTKEEAIEAIERELQRRGDAE